MEKKLRRFFIVLFLGLSVGLMTSCTKDNNGDVNSANLVGKWTVSSQTIDITINDQPIMDYLTGTMGLTQDLAQSFSDAMTSSEGGTPTGYVEIKDDGTYSSTMGLDAGAPAETGTWELSSDGKTLTLDKGTENEGTAEITTLTSSKLVMIVSDEQSQDINQDGTDETLKFSITLEMTK